MSKMYNRSCKLLHLHKPAAHEFVIKFIVTKKISRNSVSLLADFADGGETFWQRIFCTHSPLMKFVLDSESLIIFNFYLSRSGSQRVQRFYWLKMQLTGCRVMIMSYAMQHARRQRRFQLNWTDCYSLCCAAALIFSLTTICPGFYRSYPASYPP